MSELARAERRTRRAWARPGGGHDSLIASARLVLPVAILALVVYLGVAPVLNRGEISFVLAKDRVAVARERMRVADATYAGRDARGQAFRIRAGSAVQATSRDPVVKLSDLSAQLQQADGPASVTAARGRYDMSREQVMVDGPVVLRQGPEFRVDTRDVTVDLKTRTAVSAGPVDGRMPLGTFSADRLDADLRDRSVRLDGRARLHIVQGGAR